MGQPCPPCHQVPAPSLSSLALSAPSVLPALGCLPVLPEVEVAASARSPILLPCVYRVRTGPRPGRSRLLSASCRPGRALRFCSKHGRSLCTTFPLAACAFLPTKPNKVEPQAGPLARSPGQGAPRSPLDEALGARTSRAEQVLCRAPSLLDTGLFLFLLPF